MTQLPPALQHVEAVLLMLCMMYWLMHALRGMARDRCPKEIRENDHNDGFTLTFRHDAPRHYVRALKRRSTKQCTERVKHWMQVLIASSAYVSWTSPVMVVVFPVTYALRMFETSSFWGDVFYLAIALLWTGIAWYETKRDGPRWKKRGKKLLSKITVTAAGKLAVVPAKA